MADRRVNVRGNKLASEEKVWKKTENDKCFMKVQLDGMDQSKFNLPRVRRLTGTSLLQKCWRPAMHITGCLVFGQIECYAVLPPDCPKCSSMNSTILARVLDLLTQKLHKLSAELSLPPVLVINVDNTARESKNSFFGSFCATLHIGPPRDLPGSGGSVPPVRSHAQRIGPKILNDGQQNPKS